MADLWDDLQRRGLVHQWTGGDALPARLREGPVTLYCGFDPTADSLHLGNLVQLSLLRRFQRAGHRPVAVAGGATGMIGDPSGRSEERNLLSPDELEHNLAAIREQISRFVDLGGEHGAMLLNNEVWLGGFALVDFLRDVGKHAPVNVMLARESVRARLESDAGLSYTEFSYMLLQAYDFVHLWRSYGCELQVGGSDQFGNIVAGVDLARRMHGATLYGLTTPLVLDSSGRKFGKTAAGTSVWLSAARTTPYALYQYFMNLTDSDACRSLRLFSERDLEEIAEIEQRTLTAPERREAQRTVAGDVTLLVHGQDGLRAAERATQVLFGGSLDGIEEPDLLAIFADVPSVGFSRDRLAGGVPVGEAFLAAGLVRSRSDARRLVSSGGAYVNNVRLAQERDLTTADLATESVMVLRAGKKSFALLCLE